MSYSNNKKRKLSQHLASIKRNAKELTKRKLVNPVTIKVYDEIYDEGVLWLDSLAGEQVIES